MPSYTVTDRAPPKVAGRRVAPGDTLELTEAQALYEATAGHIVLVTPASPTSGVNAEATTVEAALKRSSKAR